jgi:membrane protease YdiL (CAAX protease family)
MTVPTICDGVRLRTHTLMNVVTWVVVLLISSLPVIVFREVLRIETPWLPWARVGLLAVGLLFSLFVGAFRPLWIFFAVNLMLYLAERGASHLATWPQVQLMLTASDSTFVNTLALTQAQRFAVALVMLATSWLLMRRRSALFFAVGKLDAPAAPIKLVGMLRPSTWNRLGPIMALCLAGGLVAFIAIAGGAPLSNLPRALPLLPYVLLFAATNAFGEEMSYRAPQLGALTPVVGNAQALLMTATYFGIWHFYGVPYGVVGVLMAGLFGWLLGRSMLETKGFLWAWLIHFVMDVVIFTFMAAGSVTPGGG